MQTRTMKAILNTGLMPLSQMLVMLPLSDTVALYGTLDFQDQRILQDIVWGRVVTLQSDLKRGNISEDEVNGALRLINEFKDIVRPLNARTTRKK